MNVPLRKPLARRKALIRVTWISLVTVWLLGSGAFSRNKQTWPQVYPELKHDTSLPLGRVKLDRPFEESGADEAEQIREGVGTAKPKQPLPNALVRRVQGFLRFG